MVDAAGLEPVAEILEALVKINYFQRRRISKRTKMVRSNSADTMHYRVCVKWRNVLAGKGWPFSRENQFRCCD